MEVEIEDNVYVFDDESTTYDEEAKQFFENNLIKSNKKSSKKVNKKKKRENPEYIIQCDIVKYLKELQRNKKIITFFSVINESNYLTSPKALKQGMVKGVSDLVILLQNHTIYLELKKDRPVLKSGKPSKSDYQKDEQKYFENKIKQTVANSYYCTYGYNESKQLIDEMIAKYSNIDYSNHYEL